MTWYNYKLKWINIEKCFGINYGINTASIVFMQTYEDYLIFEYDSYEERDQEFEKIKLLMGFLPTTYPANYKPILKKEIQ